MDADLKTRWVTALRSGKYEQTHGTLRNGYGTKHCALGVLCEVAGQTTGVGAYDWLDGVLGGVSNTNRVWHLNDTEGKTFPQIADYVEENL